MKKTVHAVSGMIIALLLAACSRSVEETARTEAAVETAVEGNSPRLVLEKGNEWAAGAPGFGENAIAVLTGEYSTHDGRRFQVWLTREFLFYDERWTPWPDLIETRSRRISAGNLAARPLDGVWTALFLFDGFDTGEQAEIMRICAPRFSRYVSRSGRVSDSSLPAIIIPGEL
ncbi:MAG: hypothetical protein LBJ31_01625 [Treponema sp.]|nr:hypothetical protein [Treponema sp.]